MYIPGIIIPVIIGRKEFGETEYIDRNLCDATAIFFLNKNSVLARGHLIESRIVLIKAIDVI